MITTSGDVPEEIDILVYIKLRRTLSTQVWSQNSWNISGILYLPEN